MARAFARLVHAAEATVRAHVRVYVTPRARLARLVRTTRIRLRCLLLHCSLELEFSRSVGSSTRQSLMGMNSHRLRKLLALTAAAAYIPSLCLGWWDAGHMLTVAIARQRLSNATKTELDRLIAASESVQATSPVPSTSLVSAGHWPDDVKRRDWAPSDKVMLSPSGLFVAFDAVRTRPSPFPC